MRPTKNRVFCTQCFKPKMVFESRAKALNFIRFNAEEINDENGYAPKRAYYCSSCGAWHVTHSDIHQDSIERKMEPIKECVQQKMDKFDAAIAGSDYVAVYDCALSTHFSVKGYLSLAKHLEVQTYTDDATQMQNHLFSSMLDIIRKISAEGDKDIEENRSDIAAKVFSLGVKIGNSAKGFVYTDFPGYQDICDVTAELIEKHHEANRIAFYDSGITAKDRLADKVKKYVEKIEGLIEKQEYVCASKNIHFAVFLLQKRAHQITTDMTPSIDRLIELKKQIPDWATKEQKYAEQ